MVPTSPYWTADKPAGLSTHSPDGRREGFVEYLARQTGQKLRICHRLDKETSGAIVFARTFDAVRELAELFAAQQVRKIYWMVTDRDPALGDKIEIVTDIEKRGGAWISSAQCAGGNATSRFELRHKTDRYALWRVRPTTGKPHQIRLHAQQLGMPILGDADHGGTTFPRTMLHAGEVRFSSASAGEIVHKSPAPPFFDDLQLLDDGELVTWLAALDRRRRLFGIVEQTTLRLVHADGGNMRCDLFGPVCWFYWYRDRAPRQEDLDRLATFADAANVRHWKVQVMNDRGADPQQRRHYGSGGLETWTASEHGLYYLFKAEQGLSPGLFLDQRQNRLWVQRNAKDKKVLNLFCYTAGFSLCAASGGARQVVSVDTSKATLDWARENFALNQLDGEHLEFWASDVRYFLRGCIKRQRLFDLVICDPPSFSRHKNGLFKIDRDLPELVLQILAVLEPGGTLLLCTNYEKWDFAQFEKAVMQVIDDKDATRSSAPLPDWDFELPGQEPLMKALLLQKTG